MYKYLVSSVREEREFSARGPPQIINGPSLNLIKSSHQFNLESCMII